MLNDVLRHLVDLGAPKTSYCDLAVFDDGLVVIPLGRVGGPLVWFGPLAVTAQLASAGLRHPSYEVGLSAGSARSFVGATGGARLLDPERIEMVTLDGARLRIAMVDEIREFVGLRRQMKAQHITTLLGGVLRPGCLVVRPGTLRDRSGSGAAPKPDRVPRWRPRTESRSDEFARDDPARWGPQGDLPDDDEG